MISAAPDKQGAVRRYAVRLHAVRLYGAALRLLPDPYLREYGDAMLETFTLRAAAASGGAALTLLLRELGGLVRLAWREHRGSAPGLSGAPGKHDEPSASGWAPRRPGSAGSAWITEMRHALRRLLRAPSFSLATILTLAIAAGGNATIFSIVNSILLRPLPYADSERLVAIRTASLTAGADDMEMTIGLYLLYRDESASFGSIALYDRIYRNLTADGEPARVETIQATEDFFSTLGVEAALGRTLGIADVAPDAGRVVVLADGIWRRRYGADPEIVGRTVLLDNEPFTVVGVMPPGFDFPRPGTDGWTPWSIDEANLPLMSFSYDAIARLRGSATVASTNAELEGLMHGYPEHFGWEQADFDSLGLVPFVRPLQDHTIGDVGDTLWLFAGAGLFVLLLACANVANLFLVRSESRRAEARIRTALGASRGQLLRYWMAESIWVAVLGALLGLALATSGISIVIGLAPDLPRIETAGIDGATLAFTAALTVGAALIFGTAPLLGSHHAGAASGTGLRGSTTGIGGRRSRELLVGAQVALALTLLIGAALMMQSVRNLLAADPGFDPRGVLTFRLSLPPADYPDREAAARFHEALVDRLGALPTVQSAGLARCLPLQGWCGGNPVSSPDSPLAPEAFRQVSSVKPVSSGYFESLRIPLLAGRTLVPSDSAQRSGAALVSSALAARIFPGTEPVDIIGKRIYPQSEPDVDRWFTIVGVVEAVQRSQIDEAPAEVLYVPLLGVSGDRHLAPIHDVTVAVRVDGEPLGAIDPVRRVIHELDADLPIARIRTLADIHASATARSRFATLLLALAAGIGLLLGSIGIYGVVSWATRQRTAEFGLRAALGARTVDLLQMVMARGLRVIATGIAVGIVASLAATQLLASMLYQVRPNDPATFVGVIALLAAVGALATWLPARRAACVDPADALRSS